MPVERVTGLSKFIGNQKESLKILKISLPFVLHDYIINNIMTAISNLSQLQQLDMSINGYPVDESEIIVNYFLKTLQENTDRENELKVPKT